MINLLNFRIRLRILKSKLNARKHYKRWLKQGKPVPPPHVVKQELINNYRDKYKLSVFIETGTYLGEMVYAQRNNFDLIYSVEIQPSLYEAAQKRFKKYRHITLLNGDSGEVLFNLMPTVKERALLWLDGHYSGGITGKSDVHSPIMNELKAVFTNNKDHVLLIDDAHCFTGENGYPTLEELDAWLNKNSYRSQVINNVIVAEKG